MKTRLTIAAFILAVATFTASTASAQVTAEQHTAKIPFTFHVGNAVLPAGDYAISLVGGHMQVRSLENSKSAAVAAIRLEGRHTNEATQLGFARVGDDVYLRTINFAGREDGVLLLNNVRAASRM